MANTSGKVLSASTPSFVTTGSKRAKTFTAPKAGKEQSFGNIGQGPWNDKPSGNAVTTTYAKRGQKMST